MLCLNKGKVLVIVFSQITDVPCPWDKGAGGRLKTIGTRPYLSCDIVRAFPIFCELALLYCVSHNLCVMKDKISKIDGVEFYGAIIGPSDVEFVQCVSEEGISSDGGEEFQCFMDCCVVQFLLECCKVVSVKGDFDLQHSFRPLHQYEWCLFYCRLFSYPHLPQDTMQHVGPFSLCLVQLLL